MLRKGNSGNALLFFAFFSIMIILAGGIVIGVGSFYGAGYDSRLAESEVLLSIVERCFVKENFYASGFDLGRCGLDQSIIEFNHMVYIDGPRGELFFGVRDYMTQCSFSDGMSNEDYPICAMAEISSREGNVTIVAGSNQNSRRLTG